MFSKRPEAASEDSHSSPEQLAPPTLDLQAIEQRAPRAVQNYQQAAKRPASVIGPELTVAGNVTSKGTVHIDGRIEGDVNCATLTVGESALISGGVRAEQIAVNGEVRGNINGDHVTLQPKARVSGDIHHRSLAIAQGAHFEGWARRSEAEAADRSSIEAALRAGESYEPVVLDAGTLNELPNPTTAVTDQADEDDGKQAKASESAKADTSSPEEKAKKGGVELEKTGALH